MDHVPHIQRAIEICGGSQQALADAAGLTQPGVHHLLKGGGKVKPETALAIEKATKGEVSRSQLRPDLYPPERKGRAA